MLTADQLQDKLSSYLTSAEIQENFEIMQKIRKLKEK